MHEDELGLAEEEHLRSLSDLPDGLTADGTGRLVSAEAEGDERAVEAALRPRSLD